MLNWRLLWEYNVALLYGYYADDFTGSTDVLEQLAEGGVSAVLFLRVPDKALYQRFEGVKAIGIAGDSRSRSVSWMQDKLPQMFSALQHAEVVHYKTCSTFDSSPTVGSIGKALEIGVDLLGGPAAIVVAAPHLGRYVAFGNLFAKANDTLYRIDRHPTMSRHPVTPMAEADLRLHLAEQTGRKISLLPLPDLHAENQQTQFESAGNNADAILFDGVSADDLAATGALIANNNMHFAVGSSGLTRALVSQWRNRSLTEEDKIQAPASAVEQLLVLSGSCSPVTGEQIAVAKSKCYDAIPVDMTALTRDDAEERRLVAAALASLAAKKSCIIYSAQGPLSGQPEAAGEVLGATLGRIAKKVVQETGLKRILFAGGDTSSHGVAQLNADAMTWQAPIEVGAPLVKIHSLDTSIDGLEMVLKGGQMGQPNFFESVRCGRQLAE